MASCFASKASTRRGPPLTARGFREKEELRAALQRCNSSNDSEGSKAMTDKSPSPEKRTNKRKRQSLCQEEEKTLSASLEPKKQRKDSHSSQLPTKQKLKPAVDGEPNALDVTVYPEDIDCICDRGHGANDRPGNITFRNLVAAHVSQYQKMLGNAGKKQLLQHIVKAFQSTSGRFLRHDKRCHRWYVLDDQEARAKVGQQIRYQINATCPKRQSKPINQQQEDLSEVGID